jgi:hypothetical protein
MVSRTDVIYVLLARHLVASPEDNTERAASYMKRLRKTKPSMSTITTITMIQMSAMVSSLR